MLLEITVKSDKLHTEALADALIDAGAYSVTIADADADTEEESPLFGEPGLEPETCAWDHSLLKILAGPISPLKQLLQKSVKNSGSADSVWNPRQRFRTTTGFALRKPSSNRPKSATVCGLCRLGMNRRTRMPSTSVWIPGIAFGTGSHPTTRLCLQWLESHDLQNKSVLDYGCGSGILAVAAKKLGAEAVIGTDIDPQAIESAEDNAKSNEADVVFVLPDEMPEGKFDIVVANILSNPLRLLSSALLARVAPGGSLVLSGILERQAEELIEIYRENDPTLPLEVWRTDDGWVCLAGSRR